MGLNSMENKGLGSRSTDSMVRKGLGLVDGSLVRFKNICCSGRLNLQPKMRLCVLLRDIFDL